jgi:hypothetical protein
MTPAECDAEVERKRSAPGRQTAIDEARRVTSKLPGTGMSLDEARRLSEPAPVVVPHVHADAKSRTDAALRKLNNLPDETVQSSDAAAVAARLAKALALIR